MTSLGFVILRHVCNETTNLYWLHCYECIRKFYPENQIIIVDDNSDYQYIHVYHHNLYKTMVINGEFAKRGELLGYYYYLHNKLFDTAVILHDSVFIQKYIDFSVDKYKILWDFEHGCDQIEDETKMIHSFNDPDLLAFYKNKELWTGCFGGMTIISHDFLVEIDSKYPLKNLLGFVLTRYNRCSFERVIACLLQKSYKSTVLFGNILRYMKWGITYHDKENFRHLPMIKVWTGR